MSDEDWRTRGLPEGVVRVSAATGPNGVVINIGIDRRKTHRAFWWVAAHKPGHPDPDFHRESLWRNAAEETYAALVWALGCTE